MIKRNFVWINFTTTPPITIVDLIMVEYGCTWWFHGQKRFQSLIGSLQEISPKTCIICEYYIIVLLRTSYFKINYFELSYFAITYLTLYME